MSDADTPDPATGDEQLWRERYDAAGERDADFMTLSGLPLEPLYGPHNTAVDSERVGFPGVHPFTRGPYASMYRTKPWTIRQFAGFADPRETNERFHELVDRGQHGLSVAFDMPTLMGLDSDDERSRGEVGHCGVAIDTVDDVIALFDGLNLGELTTSMTINAPAVCLFAMYVVAAEEQGVDPKQLGGTLQTDMLKEFIAQKEWLFGPEPHLRLIGDLIEHCTEHLPRYHPISISGYHIREAGATAVQELAWTLANGYAYVELGRSRGLDVDDFVPRFSFFFDAHIDFFEEIAKFRAGRRMWADTLRDTYGARTERAQMLRFHTQTAGVSLTAQQPDNNVVRTAIEALAGVLGGTQSLHTNALDEVLALPSSKAAQIALRTQQVIAEETGVTNVIDPLGGSWFVESLTDRIESLAVDEIERIAALAEPDPSSRGATAVLDGVLAGIDSGWFQGELADSAYTFQKQLEQGRARQVGVNVHVADDDDDLEILRISEEVEKAQIGRLQAVRRNRDEDRTATALKALREAAATDENLVEPMLAAVRSRATIGEVTAALQSVFGTYTETSRI